MPQLVNSFKTKKSTETDATTYDIGILAKNVYLDDNFPTLSNKNFHTLKTFYDSIKDFFKRQMHMIYQKNEPENRGIVEWYEVTVSLKNGEQTENPQGDGYVSIPTVPGMSSDVDKTSILNNNG